MTIEPTISNKHPASYFSSTGEFQEWVGGNGGEHLWHFLSPESRVEQNSYSCSVGNVLIGAFSLSTHKTEDDTTALIKFHVNSVIVDNEYRSHKLTPLIISQLEGIFQYECAVLRLEGFTTIVTELICTPTKPEAIWFCDTLNERLDSITV